MDCPARKGFVTYLFAACLAAWVSSAPAETIEAKAKKIADSPKIDGAGDDACWKDVAATSANLIGVGEVQDKITPCSLKIVHDGQSFFILVTWDDASEDTMHRDFIWEEGKKFYSESPKVEDQFSVAWELTGSFTGNMLTPVTGNQPWTWDVWQWGAARTNPLGLAKDMVYHFSQKPLKNLKPQAEHRSRQGLVFISRPEDAGAPIWKEVQIDRKKKGEAVVKQYQLGKPTGSAADVQAKGVWADGKWTLELSRKLNTAAKDDLAIVPGKSYKMALASFDKYEAQTHYASHPIRVTFEP